MNGIILQWLQSEPTCKDILLSAALLEVCLIVWLIQRITVRRRKTSAEQPDETEAFTPRELSADEASPDGLRVLAEIVYCESREVIR